MRWRGSILALAGATLIFWVMRLGIHAPMAPPWNQANVLLITVDTLRADAIEYGSQGRTPFFAAQAGNGVVFDRAYSTSSWTPPSVASILTGTYPSRHGVERSLIWPSEGRIDVLAQEALPTDLRLLPEILQGAGYATFGITANAVLERPFGYGRGFDRYVCLGFEDDGAAVVEQLDDWLEEIRSARPWFAWLHFLDPHAPYRPREPYFSNDWQSAERHPQLEETVPAGVLAKLGVTDAPPLRRYVRSLYRSEVAAVDARIQEVFQRLYDEDDVLAIVTADHGEEFLEHGRFGHGNGLFEETIRVPLLMRFPGRWQAGRRIDVPVSLVDVLPSILDAIGLEPEEGVQGSSLVPGLRGSKIDREVFAKLNRTDQARAVVHGSWKMIDVSAPQALRSVYDLGSDPGEQDPIAARPSGEEERLAAMLQRHDRSSRSARSGDNPVIPLGSSQEEALRALGYVE